MITKYLPEFKVMEVNNLTGLRSGHMLSQVKVDADIAKTGEGKWIENGIIVGLNNDGTIGNYNKSAHKTMFVHYTEELLTFLPDLKYFAVPVEETGDTYIRAVALYTGDTFTTNNYKGESDNQTYVAAKVVDGVLTLQTAADADSEFIATKSTLPDGSKAYEFMKI